ncbi:ASCH domain-containing protein [Bacillus sp. JCM 19041]|uniref:ASCH domain-containing protein n=1 Tax=Bacillus sp. JCM 19041 TaxID=1460637 RepID=UPI0006D0727A
MPDHLAELVIKGQKTATSSAALFYEIHQLPFPRVGDFAIVLNGNDQPVAIIKIVDFKLIPMNEVTGAFAIAEGDGSYENWKAIHETYYRQELEW